MAMSWKVGVSIALTLLIGVAAARAADPVRGGDTMTLKLTKATDAEVDDVHWRHHHHRGFSVGFYTPSVYSYYYPRYYYRPYVYYYPSPVYYYATPAYYYPISLSAASITADAPPDRAILSTKPSANQPPPRPPQEDAVGFPYDGGPKSPAPLPADEVKPMKTPYTVPLEGRSVSLPAAKAKYTYAAYGEEEKTKKDDRTVAVKKEQGKK
jgi:hypothetical protein